MPLFGLLPYDDERKRRLALTPGINPNAPPPPPNIAAPPRLPMRAAGNPASIPMPDVNAGVTAPTLPGQSRGQQYAGAKAAFLAGTPGHLKSAGLGALRGFQSGGLAGAIAGGAYGAADPRGLREEEFNRRVRPQILEGFAFEDADRQAQMAAQKAQQESALNQARIGEIGSQNAYRSGQLEIAGQNAGRQQAIADSQIKLNEARTEAARLGTPVYKDLIDERDGKVKTFQVFADGRKIPVGGSAAAEFKRADIKSREGIAARREAGVNAREGRRESKSKGTKPLSEIRQYAKERGISLDKAKANAINDGYRIVQ